VKVIVVSVIAVAAVAAIIILNNNDLISGNSENADTADSASFSFNESELLTQIEGTESDDTGDDLSVENQNDTAQKVQKSHSQKDTQAHSNSDDIPIESKDIHGQLADSKVQAVKTVESKLVSEELSPDERIPKPEEFPNSVFDDSGSKKSADQPKNPLKEQAFLLTNVQSRIIDRKDLIISLALELFYTDSIAGSDLRINRDALRVVARKVLQDKPLASLKKELLAEEFKNEMNGIFERKALTKVRIREFHIEKVSER
jgi:hypothetical protein